MTGTGCSGRVGTTSTTGPGVSSTRTSDVWWAWGDAVIEFDRADVTEIPLDRPENAALAPETTYTGTGRYVTGWLDPQ
ncbi:hypothetical protein SAMN04515669_5363 [Jiangella sp. DSM 45060]|nr:hypothetical protein SAMN04515669_5363 [Jiangella sp. DSM 45060]